VTKAQKQAARAEKLKQAKAILATATAAGRELSAEETTQVDALTAEAAALKGQIEAMDASAARAADIDAELAAMGNIPAPRSAQNGPISQPAPRAESVRDLAATDPNRGFRSPREFFGAVMRAGQNRRAVDPRLVPLQAAVGSDEQSEGQDPYGGFLIPQGFSPNLLAVATEADPTAGRVMAVPMGTPIVNIPARTDKNHTSSVTGGLTWSRRAETATGTDSRMQFEQVSLRANSLMGVNFSTEELLSDSPISVAALIAAGFQSEYQAVILNEKLFGTGAGQFLGVMNAPCLVSQAKETGQAANTITYDNIVKMRSRCWGYSDAIWIANHDTFPQLAKLSLAVGTGGAPVYMPSIVADRPDTLLGRPIFYSEFASTLGTAGDLILGNWSQYLEGTLQGMDMQESIHVRFLQNERTFKATVRNDGQPWWKSALTPKKSTVTLSPFVALATRA
jgi:HK97 family phage major capsid protein